MYVCINKMSIDLFLFFSFLCCLVGSEEVYGCFVVESFEIFEF